MVLMMKGVCVIMDFVQLSIHKKMFCIGISKRISKPMSIMDLAKRWCVQWKVVLAHNNIVNSTVDSTVHSDRPDVAVY